MKETETTSTLLIDYLPETKPLLEKAQTSLEDKDKDYVFHKRVGHTKTPKEILYQARWYGNYFAYNTF